MSICGGCGQEANRIHTLFEVDGKALPEPKETCEFCRDGGVHNDPAWMYHRPTPLWESRPNLYKKKDNPEGGSYYEPTDANLADLEAKILAGDSDEKAAIESKLKTRLTSIPTENMEAVLSRANHLASSAVKAYEDCVSQYINDNADYWNSVAEDLKAE